MLETTSRKINSQVSSQGLELSLSPPCPEYNQHKQHALFPVRAGWPTVRERLLSTAKKKATQNSNVFQLPAKPFSQARFNPVVATETELKLKDHSTYSKGLLSFICRELPTFTSLSFKNTGLTFLFPLRPPHNDDDSPIETNQRILRPKIWLQEVLLPIG